MRKWILMTVAAMVVAGAALAQDVPRDQATVPKPETPSTPKLSQPRGRSPILGNIGIGDRAPDFELDASNGKAEKLSSLRGKWTLVVFGERHRSLAPLDSVDVAARNIGARVVGVCHEKQQTLTTAAAREKLGMLMFADATGEVSAMYGLFDWQHGATTPGFLVLDREGTIRLAVLGRVFPPDQMLELLRFAVQGFQ